MFRKIFIFLFFIQTVNAQDELSEALNRTNYEPSYFAMLFGLFVVIGLVYLTGIIYKKLTKIKLDNSSDDKYSIQIVSSASLGQNKNLYIIKTDKTYSLVGATQNNITYIKDLGEDNEN